MNPYSPAFVPGHSRQQIQNSAALVNSNTPLLNEDFPAGSQSLVLQSSNTLNQIIPEANSNGYAHDLVAQSQPPLMAQRSHNARQTEIMSPISRRAAPSLLQKLKDLDIQDNSEGSQILAAYRQSVDKATNPNDMPIGSPVYLQEPPTWGVVKISNIPYSITKQEIVQFLGRQARLITADQGCPIHIIMERSTAKTMDCYAEFKTHGDARDTVIRINRIYESGRTPRLGNRHVDVELTDQNELLRDLFPRAKCVIWTGGRPSEKENLDPYCSGFTGFFTSEEIILAIRHAEIPHRSPFCDKCPQRTYESTISTLHKFPWGATNMYTVHDRNQLFELANRHIQTLVARIKRFNTVGLDQKLLNDLLQAGLKCPAFNERQKYTLCMNSEISSEINKLPEMSKWFPFDTLARMPNFHEEIHTYYATLISLGTDPELGTMGLTNMFPMDQPALRSPYGRIWFEWQQDSSHIRWSTAVNREMVILSSLVFSGWINDDMNNVLNNRTVSRESAFSLAPGDRRSLCLSPYDTKRSQAHTESSSRADAYTTPFRRASESGGMGGGLKLTSNRSPWNQKLLLYPSGRQSSAYRGHRNTQSSPMCLPSPTTNPWGEENFE
ncbi:hypothetical protein BDW62DRAFT_218053 [Aspergillus aurantiobrunneus]